MLLGKFAAPAAWACNLRWHQLGENGGVGGMRRKSNSEDARRRGTEGGGTGQTTLKIRLLQDDTRWVRFEKEMVLFKLAQIATITN